MGEQRIMAKGPLAVVIVPRFMAVCFCIWWGAEAIDAAFSLADRFGWIDLAPEERP